jgi:predicted ATP-dependent serine protease
MENGKVASMNCSICGNRTPDGWAGKCPRCAKVDALIEELIRKQLRDGISPRFTAMPAGGEFTAS